jgi:hypothetical protein
MLARPPASVALVVALTWVLAVWSAQLTVRP